MPSKSKPTARPKESSSSAKGRTTRQPAPPANSGSVDAIALLEADHRQVDRLFDQFEKAEGDAQKRDLSNAICVALKVHGRLEEDLFYPAAAAVVGDLTLIEEAEVEHASVKDLIAQIESGSPGEPLFDARVTVLAEYVRHHVTEEEGEIFPQCRKSDLDLAALGAAMARRKQELMTGFKVSNPVVALS